MVEIRHSFKNDFTLDSHTGDTDWVDIDTGGAFLGGLDNNTEYLIISQMGVGGNSTSGLFGFRMVHDDVEVGFSHQKTEPRRTNSIYSHQYHWFDRVTTDSNFSNFKQQYRTETSSANTVHCTEMHLLALCLDDIVENTDFFWDEDLTSLTALDNVSWTTGASVTAGNGSDDYLALYFVRPEVSSTTASMRLRLNVGGTGKPMLEFEGENLGEQWCLGGQAYLPALATDSIVKVEMQTDSSTPGAFDVTCSRVMLIRMNSFEDHYGAYKPDDVSITSLDTWTEVQGNITHTTNTTATRDWIGFTAVHCTTGDNNKATRCRTIDDNIGAIGTETEIIIQNGVNDRKIMLMIGEVSIDDGQALSTDIDVEETIDVVPAPVANDMHFVAFTYQLAAVEGSANPVVESITETTNIAPADATLDVTLDNADNVDDLLLMFLSPHPSTNDIAAPAGWTELAVNFASTNFGGILCYKKATGSEGATAVVTLSGTPQAFAAQVYRISNWDTTQAPVSTSMENLTTTSTPDPASFTSWGWGAGDNLFINGIMFADDAETVTAFPDNFTDGTLDTTADGGTDLSAQCASCYLFDNSATTVNCNAYTLSGAEGTVSTTVVIRGAVPANIYPIRQIPWNKQPPQDTQIDRSNFFGQHCVGMIIPGWSAAGQDDSTTRSDMVPIIGTPFSFDMIESGTPTSGSIFTEQVDYKGQPAVVMTQSGQGTTRFDGYKLHDATVSEGPLVGLTQFTVLSIYKPEGDGAPHIDSDPRIFTKDEGVQAADHDLMIGLNTLSNTLPRTRVRIGTTTLTVLPANIPANAVQDDAWNLIASTVRGNEVKVHGLREDGGYATGTDTGTGVYTPRTTTEMGCFGTAFSEDNQFIGQLLGVWFFDESFDDPALLRDFFENPWQIFEPIVQPLLILQPEVVGVTAYPISQIPWTTKPPEGTPLNLSHPMAQDLFFFCAMDRTGAQYDLVNNREGIVVEDVAGQITYQVPTVDGLVVKTEIESGTDSAGFNFGNTGTDGIYDPVAVTIISRARVEDEVDSGGSRIVSKRTAAGGDDCWAIFLRSSTIWAFRANQPDLSNPDKDITRTSGDYFGVLVDVALAVDDDGQDNYVWEPETGAKQTLLAQTGTTGGLARETGNLCTQHRDGQDRTFDGEIYYVALFNTKKSEEFIEAFRNNPWQIFEPLYLPLLISTDIVDIGLTGVESTSAIDILGVSIDVALTGVLATSDVGTVDKVNEQDLIGVSATGAVGTVVEVVEEFEDIAYPIRQVPWNKQPPQGTEIDRSNFFGQHCVAMIIPGWSAAGQDDSTTRSDVVPIIGTPFVFDTVEVGTATSGAIFTQPVDYKGQSAVVMTQSGRGAAQNEGYKLLDSTVSEGPLAGEDQFTVIGIYRPEGNGVPVAGSDPRIFTKDEGTAGSDHDLMIGLKDSGAQVNTVPRTRVRIGGTTLTVVAADTAANAIQNDAWNLVASTVKGNEVTVHGLREDGGYATATDTGTGVYTSRTTTEMAVFGTAGVAGNQYIGQLLGVWFFDVSFGDPATLRDFFENPWQIFEPIIQPLLFLGSAGVEVALTGVEATSDVDNVGLSIDGSQALTGVEATSDIGTIDKTLDVDLIGEEATSAVGTVGASSEGSADLTGVEGTAAVGNVSFTESGSVKLIGVVGTSAVGTVGFTEEGSVALTSVVGTSAVGSITASSEGSATITGVVGTSSVGTLDKTNDQDLTGVNSTSAVGIPGASIPASATLTGVEGTSDIGNISASSVGPVTLPISGVQINAKVGSVLTVGGISNLGVPVFKRDTKIYISKSDQAGADATNTVEILVKDFSFNKQSIMGVDRKNTMSETEDRGVRPHIQSLSPVSFSFTTYINPLVDTNVTSPEEYLWVSLMGSDTLTSNPTSSTIDFADGNVSELQNLTLWFDRPTHDSGNYRLDNAVVDSMDISFDINQLAQIVWTGRALAIVEDSVPPAATDRKSTGCLKNKLTTIAININAVNYTVALIGGNITINNNNTFYGRTQLGKTTVPVGNYTGSREISGTMQFYFKVGLSNSVDLFDVILANASTDTYEDTYLANITIIIGGGVAPNLQINLPQTLLKLTQQEFGEVISLNVPFTIKEETGNYISVVYKA